MFTINIYLRLALTAVCLVGGIALWATLGFWYALPFLLIGISLIVGYILLGTVQSAAALLQGNDLVAAEKQLDLTYFPQWLFGPNKSAFYMMKSSFAMNRRDMKESELWLDKIQNMTLSSDNERAMLQLQIASMQASKGNLTGAKAAIRKAKELKITEPSLKDQLRQFEKMLEQSGQQKHALMMRGQAHKGYRRPKNR
jgi:hypothetical protein